MFKEFLALPQYCVYAVIETSGKPLVVSHSQCMGQTMARLYEDYAGRGLALDLRVLSVSTDIETLKLHTEYWRRKLGYGGHSRASLQYRVRVRVAGDLDTYEVVLVNARNDSKVVGVFDSGIEAEEFVEDCYGARNELVMPVYANNARTRAFLEERGMSKITRK